MNAFFVILLINLFFFIISIISQSVSISLAASVLLFSIIVFFINRGWLKLKPTNFRIAERISHLNKRSYFITIICLVLFLLLEPFLGFNGALFTAFFLFAHLNNLDSRACFFMALIFLSLTVLFVFFNGPKAAEEVSVTTYYFMIVGTFWQFFEIKNEPIELKQKLPFNVENKFITRKNIEDRSAIKRLFIYLITIVLICFISYFVDKNFSPIIKELINPTFRSPVILNEK